MTNPLVAAIPFSGTGSYQAVRQNLALALALPLKDAAAVAAFHSWNLADEATPFPAVIYDGFVYEYDSEDSLTAHDADNGCITDGSGRRYIRRLAKKPDHIVLDKDLTSPPVSPAEGDAYYVATAATGDWAGKDGMVAVRGSRGWHFREVMEGHILYVADEACYYHMPDSGTLTKGMGDLALADGSIKSRHLDRPFGFQVEAEQNAPPGSVPGAEVAYIIGAAPTGAWETHAGKVAISNGADWTIRAPAAGSRIYDKTAGYTKVFRSGTWQRETPLPAVLRVGSVAAVNNVGTSGTAWRQIANFGSKTISDTDNKWRIRMYAYVENDNAQTAYHNLQFGVFYDSETTPRAVTPARPSFNAGTDNTDGNCYAEIFSVAPADASAHIISIAMRRSAGTSPAEYRTLGGSAEIDEVNEL